MCLPDSDYQRFTWVKGFKVFAPYTLATIVGYKTIAHVYNQQSNLFDRVKREAAKLHKSQPVFSALRAQDDPERNETLVYRRTDQGRVIIGDIRDIGKAERRMVVPKYPTSLELIIEAAA
jgi:hypothetical protein